MRMRIFGGRMKIIKIVFFALAILAGAATIQSARVNAGTGSTTTAMVDKDPGV